MSNRNPPSPMLAKSDETVSTTGRASNSATADLQAPLIPPDAQPEEVLETIRSLLTDHSIKARRMAIEAAARFPEHAGILNARRILDGGRATVGSGGPEPSTREEFEWLRHPPDSVRGQWVAVIDREMIGSAETLAELTTLLRSKRLPKPALVHRID